MFMNLLSGLLPILTVTFNLSYLLAGLVAADMLGLRSAFFLFGAFALVGGFLALVLPKQIVRVAN